MCIKITILASKASLLYDLEKGPWKKKGDIDFVVKNDGHKTSGSIFKTNCNLTFEGGIILVLFFVMITCYGVNNVVIGFIEMFSHVQFNWLGL